MILKVQQLVELRGCLSNFELRRIVRDVQSLLDGEPITVAQGEMTSIHAKVRAPESVRARLGDAAVADLIAEFVAGTTRQELVARYDVSLSSLKILLHGSGIHRVDPPADEPRR